jgi:Flp pilus assembly protein TadG
MRSLLRDRRGVSAFVTIIALTPLIGVVAFGAEGGSWYVTKQASQNAADGAAYSGALTLACTLGGSCADGQSVPYRGKEFAAQNAFCNAGDTSYPNSRCSTSLGQGVSQAVTIAAGDYSAGTFTTPPTSNGGNGNAVRAIVSQTQPAYLSAILGLSTVTVGGHAIAQVNSLPNPACTLALTGSISFQGSPNINAPGCDMGSNDTANNALNFTGGGMTLGAGLTLSAAGGCTGASSFCSQALTHMPPVTNPFSALDGALTTLCGANPTLPATCGLSTKSNTCPMFTAYTAATPCTNNNPKTTGNKAYPLTPGVYFISGSLTLTGGSSITGTGVTFILLPGATIDTKGGGTLTLTGPTSAPGASSLPPSLQADASLFQGMALYDASNAAVQFGGTSNINITGNIYAPTAAVTFQGNPTITLSNGDQCGELIAASIAFNGNATFNDSSCPRGLAPSGQYVQLVQ